MSKNTDMPIDYTAMTLLGSAQCQPAYLSNERFARDMSYWFSNDASLVSTKSQDLGFSALTDSFERQPGVTGPEGKCKTISMTLPASRTLTNV